MIDMFVKAQKVFSGPAKVLGMCKESVCGVDDLHTESRWFQIDGVVCYNYCSCNIIIIIILLLIVIVIAIIIIVVRYYFFVVVEQQTISRLL